MKDEPHSFFRSIDFSRSKRGQEASHRTSLATVISATVADNAIYPFYTSGS
jgi:hypothetical protein